MLAFVPLAVTEAVLATAASTLFESTPFILAGMLLAGAASRRGARLASLLGCGCSGGPGALALPVFGATMLALGPIVALMRSAAAVVAARVRRAPAPHDARPELGSSLQELLPTALASGVFFAFAPAHALSMLHPALAVVCVVLATFCASPCGFGAIALAATLRASAPYCAIAVLCIAGICDLRSLRFTRASAALHDAPAYAITALACLLLAIHHGNALINPRFVVPLFCSAAMLAFLAWRYRDRRAAGARWAPGLMLLASILTAPAPPYVASATTLGDAFAGETLTFAGSVVTAGEATSLVRYAITCCRADAQPVAIRLTANLREPAGQWIRARGHIVRNGPSLELRVERYVRIPAPADPFLYR